MKMHIVRCDCKMPFKDPDMARQKDREYKRKSRSKAEADKKNSSPDPLTIETLLCALSEALAAVRASTGDVIVKSRAIGFLCNIGFKGLEIADLDERLKALESEVQQNGRNKKKDSRP